MKKNMLAVAAVGFAAVLTLGAMTACAESAGKVGICLPARDQYWTTFEGALGENLEAAGYEFQTVVAGDKGEEVSTQISQVQTFNNNGFDAIVLGMATGGSGADFMQNVGDMKVIFFNRAVEEGVTDGTQSVYIGMAEYDAGYAQGEWLANYFNEAGKTEVKGMMFMGVLGQDSVTNRTQGAKDALEENGITVDWVFEQTGEWDRTKAMDLFTQFVGTNAEFDFVCANNDEMALGVIEACSAMNKEIDFPIVGVDATGTDEQVNSALANASVNAEATPVAVAITAITLDRTAGTVSISADTEGAAVGSFASDIYTIPAGSDTLELTCKVMHRDSLDSGDWAVIKTEKVTIEKKSRTYTFNLGSSSIDLSSGFFKVSLEK